MIVEMLTGVGVPAEWLPRLAAAEFAGRRWPVGWSRGRVDRSRRRHRRHRVLQSAAPTVAVRLVDSGRELMMRLDEPVGLGPRSADDESDGSSATTTADVVRLIYGRSGPGIASTSTKLTGPVTMEAVRTVFPGF